MSSFYWTAEGFFMDDLFQAAKGDGPLYADKHLVVTRTEMPFGLRFAGEIDISNSDAVGQVLRAIFPDGDSPHLDLSRLSFCDVSGIRALVDAAADLDEGGRLMLDGASSDRLVGAAEPRAVPVRSRPRMDQLRWNGGEQPGPSRD